MKINPKFTGVFMSLIIALGMSFVISFAMTAINIGFTNLFLFAWLGSWLIGLLVGFPTAALIVPLARKIVTHLTGEKLK